MFKSRGSKALSLVAAGFLALMALVPAYAQDAAPTGKAYLGAFKDNTVDVIDLSTNAVISKIPVAAGPHGMVFTPDGKWLYVSSDGDSVVNVIDTSSDTVTQTIEVGKAPHGLAITPDGKEVLVAVSGTDKVAVIDAATNAVTAQLDAPKPHNIAISLDGKWAYVASQKDGAVQLTILNLADMTQKAGVVPLRAIPRALNFSPDGKWLYFTLVGVDAVQVLDMATNAITQIPVSPAPHHPLFTANGEYALVVSQTDGVLSVIDPEKNSVEATVTVGAMPNWIALSADQETAYITNENDNTVSVVDLENDTVTATIPVGQAPRKIVVQPSAMTEMTPEATPEATMES